MTDINRELAEDAALDYSDDEVAREAFISGWLFFCGYDEEWSVSLSHGGGHHFINGYNDARDAPE